MPLDLAAALGFVATALHVVGFVSIHHVLKHGRTAQGTIAWAVALLTLPYVAVPLYWVVGRYRYQGYVLARRAGDEKLRNIVEKVEASSESAEPPAGWNEERYGPFETLAAGGFTTGNRVELLIDGTATFDSMLEGIDAAERYVLVQFYIMRADAIGQELKERLIAKAQAGVPVYVLFDVIGCYKLSSDYTDELRRAGVDVRGFGVLRKRRNRLQINFRNHRKITVVDGRRAWVGGHNSGDEYLGRDPGFGPWRDTHVVFEGPVVQGVQLAFLEDWYWAAQSIPELEWKPAPAEGGDLTALAIPSSPADPIETCTLFFQQAIHSARRRLWIATPYFVPDEPVVDALQLAALRGVDVRVMLPQKADHPLVWLSSFSYSDQMIDAGVRFWRYQPGFLHQKVLLVDDDLAAVGTANLDNRSFRLNFEVTLLVVGKPFAEAVEAMLLRDFEASIEADADDLERLAWWKQLGARVARLLAPVQ